MMWWIMAVYQIVILFVDLIYLQARIIFLFLSSVYYYFDPPKMKSVVGETVLITGAGHGIGKELSLQFARLGAKVVCLDVNQNWNDLTVAQIAKEGGSAKGFQCDVSSRDEVRSVSDKIRETVGDITILVNNAGIMPCKPFLKNTTEEIQKTFAVNVYSQLWTISEWLPTFQEKGRGHIVGMSSMCGVMGTPNLTIYCSSKFAITGLMEALFEELRYANQNPGIKLTRIHPFTVATGLALKPRIRFPSINREVQPDECASAIIQAVRREEEVVFVHHHYLIMHKLFGLLPRKVQQAILDFMDTGVDPHDN